jgi:hypothetical protein
VRRQKSEGRSEKGKGGARAIALFFFWVTIGCSGAWADGMVEQRRGRWENIAELHLLAKAAHTAVERAR